MKREAKRITPDDLSPELRQRYDEAKRAAPEVRRLIELERHTSRSLRRALAGLRAAREAAGVSQAELADRAGLDPEQVRRLEEDDLFEVDLGLVVRYADALGKRAVVQIADR